MNKRNLTLDILRGHFLLAVYVDHLSYYVNNNIFIFYNGFGNLFVSAAEGFVFISGLLVGLIYKDKLINFGLKKVYSLLLKRGLKLYLLSCTLTILFTYLAIYTNYTKVIGWGYINSGFIQILKSTLTFKYFYGWQDILALYVPLILASPFIIALFKNKLWPFVLVTSFIIWGLTIKRIYCSFYCISYFDLASWQLLYVIGLFVGYYYNQFKKYIIKIQLNKYINTLLIIIFLVSLILSILVVYYKFFHNYIDFFNLVFNKPTIGIGRLFLFFNWFYIYYIFINKFKDKIIKYLGFIYLTFGKNSLLTYSVQAFILFFAYFLPKPNGYVLASIATVFYILGLLIVIKSILKIKRIFIN